MCIHKVFILKELRQITVVGLGLLGGSLSLAVSRSFSKIKSVGYSHRVSTRDKSRQLGIATEVFDDIGRSVSEADMVILCTPICTFEKIFKEIAVSLPEGCIVTDVGSTKVMVHRWAAKYLPKHVRYVGSHPIAGSEKRGVEFARDDLFDGADCILTLTSKTDGRAVKVLKEFWSKVGCCVKEMLPSEHDRIFSKVSHLPHITAAALLNANELKDLRFAGMGFIDTTRIASGPVNVWADILHTNANNCSKGIDKITSELQKLKKAINGKDRKQIEQLLAKARNKRGSVIDYKIKKKELL